MDIFDIMGMIIIGYGVLHFASKVYEGIRCEEAGEEYPDHKFNIFGLILLTVALLIGCIFLYYTKIN